MSLFLAWVVYPLVLLALCVGLGLLVDVLCGRRLPGPLVPPVGLAAIVVVGQFTTLADATAELTVPLLLFLAVIGLAFSLPWRFGRPDWRPAAVALAAFAAFGAPVILSGQPTFAGFIMLDDTATWLALTDRIMEYGRSPLDDLLPSTYRATLDFNLAGGYPIGVFIPFGAAQKLVGGDLAWVFQPYVSFLAAMLALGLWRILDGIVARPIQRGLVVFVATQAALLVGYALWGGVKEVAATALIALAVALAPAVVRPGGSLRDALPLALAAAALVGVLSMGGIVWLAPALLALAVLAWRRFGFRGAAWRALAFAVPFAVLVVPVVSQGLVPPTSSPLTDPNAQGNLRGPLSAWQALGIWPSGDFRFDPDETVVTAVLIALGLAAAAAGLWVAWARRNATLLLYASTLIAGAALVLVGSPWAGAKGLATSSPVLLTLALVGALALLRFDRPIGVALLALVAGGVLWSNVLAYGGASLAPYDQLVELERIGDEFAGQGPALMTEYNPNGARHFLRTLDAEGASELRVRPVTLRNGGMAEKGTAPDVDEIDRDALLEYRTLVLRASPVRSRPPSPYRLVWAGEHYEVWQRPEALSGPPPEHLPLGDEVDRSGMPSCSDVVELQRQAQADGFREARMLAARGALTLDATDGSLSVPRSGAYVAWLKGSIRGLVELFVDGQAAASQRHVLNNDGGFVRLGEVRLARGPHEVELRFGGADLHPGSGGFPRPPTGPLLFARAGREVGEIVSVPIDEARSLCGQRWDWIEAVGSG